MTDTAALHARIAELEKALKQIAAGADNHWCRGIARDALAADTAGLLGSKIDKLEIEVARLRGRLVVYDYACVQHERTIAELCEELDRLVKERDAAVEANRTNWPRDMT